MGLLDLCFIGVIFTLLTLFDRISELSVVKFIFRSANYGAYFLIGYGVYHLQHTMLQLLLFT